MAKNKKTTLAVNEPPWKSIDKGIRREVRVLWEAGIHTTESCEGSRGHSFPEPTVRFAGGQAEGFRALAIANENGLRVSELRRVWQIIDGEPVGPEWEMVFYHQEHGLHAVMRNGKNRFEWR